MTEAMGPPLRSGLHRYALIDRGEALTINAGQSGIPVVPAGLEAVAQQLPLLVDMAALGPDAPAMLAGWTVQACQSESGCGLTVLDTTVSAAVLSEHLCEAMLWSADDGRRHLLRYFDARVMAQLEWLLLGDAFNRLLGPVCEWHIFLDGGWHTIAGDAGRPSLAPPMSLDTFAALGWLDVITPAISATAPANVRSRQRMALQAYELLRTAQRRFGLRNRADLSLFVQHGLCLHPQFHDHPLVRRALEQQYGGEVCYRLVATQLPPDVLQRIRTDLIHLRGQPL